MARTRDRNEAVILRKQGLSYSQIKRRLNVSKSTLSYWLHDYPLTKERIRELRDWNEQRIERYRETRRKTRDARLHATYNEQRERILPLLKRDLFIAGLFLYWGEGTKTRTAEIGVTNTDPAVLLFFLKWLKDAPDIPYSAIRVVLHLYSDMNVEAEMQYWSQILNISLSHFKKPYIKKSKKAELTRKGGFGHGTCEIRVSGARLSEAVLLGVQVLRDHFGP